jgi:hypothetical protein
MGSDRAKISYDPTRQYRAVVAQQGRVTLEADWNEAHQIANEELREETLDFVGASGTPDNGYEVMMIKDTQSDFAPTKGTMYVGGLRVFSDEPIKYSNQLDWLDYSGDPDWVKSGALDEGQIELVYLLLREQEVSAVEDSALLEKALGGPDTTQRLRLIQHIVRLQTKGENCSSALKEAIDFWQKERGLKFDPSTLRLLSAATLQVSFAPPSIPVDLCEPEARSGYLGADNQLIRVQIIGFDSNKNKGRFVWGFDNAAFLYRAEPYGAEVQADNITTLRLKSRPVDEFHRPRANQAVEVLRSAAKLHNDEYIAAATGLFTTLTANYDLYNGTDGIVNLAKALPANYDKAQTPRLFLRVWEKIHDFTSGTPVSLEGTGLQVTLNNNNQPWHLGDYWQIAVRPGEPTEVYPRRYLEAPQPPDGPRLWACPLAVIRWQSDRSLKILQDCRERFDDLVKLTKRQSGGCCTVVVKPEDLNSKITLQSIVDKFAQPGFPNRNHITICLMPGIYELPRSLELGPDHSNLTLEGCGDGAELQAKLGYDEKDFLHGLIVLNHADSVTLRNLKFQLPILHLNNASSEVTPFLGLDKKSLNVASSEGTRQVSIGIRPLHCALLTVQNCLFQFQVNGNSLLFAVGIFAGSKCWGLQLINNRFLEENGLVAEEVKLNGEKRLFLIGYLLSPSLTTAKTQIQFTQEPNTSSQVQNPYEVLAPSFLQDAVIRDNRFIGLTTAMLILADIGMVRLESNTVFQCLCGFWLTPSKHWEFLETGNRMVLFGLLFPLPEFFTLKEPPPKLNDDKLSLSLHASANDIDIIDQVNEDYQKDLRSFGLVVAENIPQPQREGGRPTSSTVLLTANKFRNHILTYPDDDQMSQSTVYISNIERCTVTGNLILNEKGGRGKCLVINKLTTNGEDADIPVISVTGNIFQGRRDLPAHPYSGLSIDTWDFLNTVI